MIVFFIKALSFYRKGFFLTKIRHYLRAGWRLFLSRILERNMGKTATGIVFPEQHFNSLGTRYGPSPQTF